MIFQPWLPPRPTAILQLQSREEHTVHEPLPFTLPCNLVLSTLKTMPDRQLLNNLSDKHSLLASVI